MKVKELLAKQVAFEEAVWSIRDILWKNTDVLTLTSPLLEVLEDTTRHYIPASWDEWGTVSPPATVEEEDLRVIQTLLSLHEAEPTPDVSAVALLKSVEANAKRECPWAEQAFGQRYLYEQVGRLGGTDDHSVLTSIYEATEPSHPTAGKLSKAVFTRLAMDYPADVYPEMVLIAQNVLLGGFLIEDVSPTSK